MVFYQVRDLLRLIAVLGDWPVFLRLQAGIGLHRGGKYLSSRLRHLAAHRLGLLFDGRWRVHALLNTATSMSQVQLRLILHLV